MDEDADPFYGILMDKGYVGAQLLTNAYIPKKKTKKKPIKCIG